MYVVNVARLIELEHLIKILIDFKCPLYAQIGLRNKKAKVLYHNFMRILIKEKISQRNKKERLNCKSVVVLSLILSNKIKYVLIIINYVCNSSFNLFHQAKFLKLLWLSLKEMCQALAYLGQEMIWLSPGSSAIVIKN